MIKKILGADWLRIVTKASMALGLCVGLVPQGNVNALNETPDPIVYRYADGSSSWVNPPCDDVTPAVVRYKIEIGEGFDPAIKYEGLRFGFSRINWEGDRVNHWVTFAVEPGQKEVVQQESWGLRPAPGTPYLNCLDHVFEGTGLTALKMGYGDEDCGTVEDGSAAAGSGVPFKVRWEFRVKRNEFNTPQVRTPEDPTEQLVQIVNVRVKLADCVTCEEGFCAPGQSEATNNSIHYKLDMGKAANGKPVSLRIDSDTVTPSIHTTAPVIPDRTWEDWDYLEGAERLFFKAPSCYVLKKSVSSFKYELQMFNPGPWTSSSVPSRKIVVENPDASEAVYNRVKITEFEGATISKSFEWEFDSSTSTWALSKKYGSSETLEQIDEIAETNDGPTGDRIRTRTIRNGDSEVMSKVRTRFHTFPWGEEQIEEVNDPDGAALTSTWEFYDDEGTAPAGCYGKLRLEVMSNQNWRRYVYDPNGRISKEIGPFLNALPTAEEDDCRVTSYTYSDSNPRCTRIEETLGEETRRIYSALVYPENWDIICQAPGAAWDAAGNLITKRQYKQVFNPASPLVSVEEPNGVITTYTETIAENLIIEKQRRTATGAENGRIGTETKISYNGNRQQLSRETKDLRTNIVIEQTVNASLDAAGRPTRIDYLDGTYETFTYGCCGVEDHRDRLGVVTSYGYDAEGNLISELRAGVTTTSIYDAMNRPIQTIRTGSDSSAIVQNSTGYDVAGRIVSSKDALANETIFVEAFGVDGETIRTKTNPDAGTEIQTISRDGTLLSISGTAVSPVSFEHNVESNELVRKETKMWGDNLEWCKHYTDFVGRDYKRIYPDDAVEETFYNDKGELVSEVDADGVRILYAHNSLGEIEYTATDFNENGEIDFAGADRLERTVADIALREGERVMRETTYLWSQDGVDAPQVVLIKERSLVGLKVWESSGSLVQSREITVSGEGYIESTIYPDGSRMETFFEDGKQRTSTLRDSGGAQVVRKEQVYDPHNRVAELIDTRNGSTIFTYDSLDHVISSTQPAPSIGQGNPVTTVEYNWRGTPVKVTHPDETETVHEYYLNGKLKKSSGAMTLLTEYTYDPQGRIKTMSTQNGDTTFNYDPQRGWLMSKLNDDAHGPNYTYTEAGRIETREWARGVTTTYSYNGAGEIDEVDYSDATPTVQFEYNRAGQETGRTDAAGDRNFIRRPDGLLIEESVVGGILDGSCLRFQYDSLMRRVSTAAVVGGRQVNRSSMEYDGASRIASVSNDTLKASYTYLQGSMLPKSIVVAKSERTVLRTEMSWDSLDRLERITNNSPKLTSEIAYDYDLRNQRTQRASEDGMIWGYSYDLAGQVISGKKKLPNGELLKGYAFEYAYDEGGNRISTEINTQTAVYVPNNLNQYSSRDVPGVIDAVGRAHGKAQVTANNFPADRQGETFFSQVAADNGSAPTIADAKIHASRGTFVEEEGRRIFLPESPENFSYDLDGNLASDGRWQYAWDGENRLISMETRSDVPSEAKLKMIFQYDSAGRRIHKSVFHWNSGISNFETEPASETKFIYDGANLIVELNAEDQEIRSYLWGKDISGSLSGAGGIGGLISVKRGAEEYAFGLDGSGNVLRVFSVIDGRSCAEFEYGPYGECIRATGVAVDDIPFRFSTKYCDLESGFYYYGFRYYSPSLGRWLSKDPIEEEGGVNPYVFASNSPIDIVDPLGLQDWEGWTYVGPGQYASESIPATGPRVTERQRREVRQLFLRCGCHTCGRKTGPSVGDHQPPTQHNPDNSPPRLYPQCRRCSNRQGGFLSYLVKPSGSTGASRATRAGAIAELLAGATSIMIAVDQYDQQSILEAGIASALASCSQQKRLRPAKTEGCCSIEVLIRWSTPPQRTIWFYLGDQNIKLHFTAPSGPRIQSVSGVYHPIPCEQVPAAQVLTSPDSNYHTIEQNTVDF